MSTEQGVLLVITSCPCFEDESCKGGSIADKAVQIQQVLDNNEIKNEAPVLRSWQITKCFSHYFILPLPLYFLFSCWRMNWFP